MSKLIFKDGLQYLFEIGHPGVEIGSNIEYMGSVELYHNEEDYDEFDIDED